MTNTTWTCPNCDLFLQSVTHPVRCHCGTQTDAGGTTLSRGIGDTVAKITRAVGIKPCGGCKSRQKLLNALLPNKKSKRDLLVLVPAGASSSFTDTRGELIGEMLTPSGITTHVVPIQRADVDQLQQLLDVVKPRVVINQAMIVGPEQVVQLVAGRPKTKWLTINHSSFADMVRVRNWLKHHCAFLELARDDARMFYGHVDDRKLINRFNVSRALYVPNVVRVPDAPAGPFHIDDTQPRLSIVSRFDPSKNITNQLIAASMIPGCVVELCTHNDARDVLEPFARSLGVTVNWSTFRDWPQYMQWIRDHVDIGLQCSFTESMNYVALEHQMSGVPVVTGHAVRYTTEYATAIADDPRDIARVVRDHIDNYEQRAASALVASRRFATRNNTEFVDVMQKRLF